MTEELQGRQVLPFGPLYEDVRDVLRRHGKPMALVALIFAGAPAAVADLLQGDRMHPSAAWFLAFLASIALAFVAQGATIAAVFDDAAGRPVDLKGLIDQGLAKLHKLVPVGLVMGLAVCLGLVLLLVPGIMLGMAWFVAAPVVVAQGGAVGAVLKESARLTRGLRWRLFEIVLILAVAAILVGLVFGVVVAVLTFLPGGHLVVALLQGVLSALYFLIPQTLSAVLYLRLVGLKGFAGAEPAL